MRGRTASPMEDWLSPILVRSTAVILLEMAVTSPLASAERITFGDWVLECARKDEGAAGCQLRQTLADGNGRRVLQLSIKRAGGTAFLEAITPLSISIPFGVVLITEAVAAGSADTWSAEGKTAQSKAGTAKPAGKDGKAAATSDAAGAVALQLASCDPDGCRAVAALDDNLLGTLKAAPRLAVRFQDSKSGKVLTIEASPKGLAEGAPLVLAAP